MLSTTSSSKEHFFPFILAGGRGERFWPASRTKTPKHLLRLLSQETLLEQTLQRFAGISNPDQLFILTNEAQREVTEATLPEFPSAQILTEPSKRDTAPAAALATAWALRHDPEAVIGLFAADAMIHQKETFQQQLQEAIHFLEQTPSATHPPLLTVSITPTYPATGFGYLELGTPLNLSTSPSGSNTRSSFYQVARFVEKPNLPKAEEFLQAGNYGWNAGIFLWKGSSFLAECERQEPHLASFIKEMITTSDPEKLLTEKFEHLPKISIDYAIMEGAKNVVALQATFDWDDVGSWRSLPQHLGVDHEKNTIPAHSQEVITLDAKNNIVLSEEKTIALCGVENLVVVETKDAILICHRDSVEKIKQLPLPEELR